MFFFVADIQNLSSVLFFQAGIWNALSPSFKWGSHYCREACAKNEASTKLLAEDSSQPLNYYAAFAKVFISIVNIFTIFATKNWYWQVMEISFNCCSTQIKDEIKPNTYVISEGANTMDIGRVSPQQPLVVCNCINNVCIPWEISCQI